MDKKVGYALHQISEGSVISNSIKCKLANQKQFLVFAKRKELIFFGIVENGINPLYKVPFTKTIVFLRVITSKSLGKQTGSDLIVAYFHDYSFIVFSDIRRIKFQYSPPAVDAISNYICETHHYNPILFVLNKIGQLSFWNPIDNPNKVYNIQCPDQRIIDLKFIPHQDVRLAILTDTNAGSRSVKAYTFNRKFLRLEEITRLSVDLLHDSTSSIIVPFAHGDHEKPVYLVLGTETISLVFKTGVVNTDSGFEGSAPQCYCELGGWSSLVATNSGSLYGLYFDSQFNMFKIGDISILPTSITKIDGNIFFIGSSCGDSVFAQITNDSIQILQEIPQFTPVNSISSFCESVGSIFLTQGNNKTSSISELKTGTTFIKEVEISFPYIESIFSTCDHYLILSLFNDHSVCVDCQKYEEVSIDRFLTDCKTLNVLPRDDDSFFQVCSNTIRAVGNGTNSASISYDSEIIYSTADDENILLLFSDNAEIVSKNLEPITQFHFDNSRAFTADFYQGMVAVSFYTNEIQIMSTSRIISSIKIEEKELITFLHFMNNKKEATLFAFSEDGSITRFKVPDLQVISHIQLGYQIKNIFKMNTSKEHIDSLFINSSSPVLFYPDGTFSSVACEPHSTSCSLKNSHIAIVKNSELMIGALDDSNICSIIPKHCESRPLLFSIHKEPLSLFVSFEKGMKFVVSSFLLPSFSQTFSHELQDYEEVTCLYYHESLKATFFGTALNSPRVPLKGILFAVKELFNEFTVVCTEEIEGNVYTINSSKPNNLIVGSTCKMIIMSVSSQFNGSLKIEVSQIVPTEVIPRSISILDRFIIYFGATKSISIFEEQDGSYAKYDEIFIKTKIHTGFIGIPLTAQSCHVFTIEDEKILTLSLFTFEDGSVLRDIITTYQLEGPVSYCHPVRDGFALISTRNGSLCALQRYRYDHILLLRKVASDISKNLPFANDHSKILDASILDLYDELPPNLKEEIAAVVKKKPDDIKNFIESLSHALSLMCSTQQEKKKS